jgi:hypothetical protein
MTAPDVLADIREAHRFDPRAFEAWLQENVAGYAGPLRIEQFNGGQSNPTYRLTTPGQGYVLRRKPPGELLKGAHAVDREARAIQALHSAGFGIIHGIKGRVLRGTAASVNAKELITTLPFYARSAWEAAQGR